MFGSEKVWKALKQCRNYSIWKHNETNLFFWYSFHGEFRVAKTYMIRFQNWNVKVSTPLKTHKVYCWWGILTINGASKVKAESSFSTASLMHYFCQTYRSKSSPYEVDLTLALAPAVASCKNGLFLPTKPVITPILNQGPYPQIYIFLQFAPLHCFSMTELEMSMTTPLSIFCPWITVLVVLQGSFTAKINKRCYECAVSSLERSFAALLGYICNIYNPFWDMLHSRKESDNKLKYILNRSKSLFC